MESIYVGVSLMGLIHGLEPGHGWPLALLYATPKRRPLFAAFLSSGILSFFHFFSSIVVVVTFLLFRSTVNFSGAWMSYLASLLLFLLALRLFLEKPKSFTEAQHGIFTIAREKWSMSTNISIPARNLTAICISMHAGWR